MQAEMPCEQFGAERSAEIEGLIHAATGEPCPGRRGEPCPLSPEARDAVRLRVVAS